MEWHTVRIDDETELEAADFLGGVLVGVEVDNLVYVPGWRVKLKTGDMDHNVLRPREVEGG